MVEFSRLIEQKEEGRIVGRKEKGMHSRVLTKLRSTRD